MRMRIFGVVAVVGGLCGVGFSGSPLRANPLVHSYTFTRIADNRGPLAELLTPTLNDLGTVAFLATLDSGGKAIIKGNSSQLITVAETTSFPDFNPPTINNSGVVAFCAREFDSGPGLAIYAGTRRNEIKLIADRSDGPFEDLSTMPSITDSNVVVFWGRLVGGGQRISARNVYEGPVFTVVDNDGTFSALDQGPIVNNSGVVAFAGQLSTGVDGIFTISRGVITTIADSSGPFHLFSGGPSVSDSGWVAFHSSLDTGITGVFTGRARGPVAQIADDSGPFVGFAGGPGVNNWGGVAFVARLPNSGIGLFTGPDPVADKVIASGDVVDGRVVVGLQFFRGLNNRGQIAFVAYFSDNSIEVLRADPRL